MNYYLKELAEVELPQGYAYYELSHLISAASKSNIEQVEEVLEEADLGLDISSLEGFTLALTERKFCMVNDILSGDIDALKRLAEFIRRKYQDIHSQEIVTKLYIKLAKLGDAEAMFSLYKIYEKEMEFDLSNDFLFEAALSGNADAMLQLGFDFENNGRYEEANKWYRKSAESGNSSAMGNLAHNLYIGRGTNPDRKKAIEWCKASAELGSSRSMFNLGQMLTDDKSTEVEQNQSFFWFEQAAKSGHLGAMHKIGNIFADGEEVTQDLEQAKHWYEMAANDGSVEAMFCLGLLYTEHPTIADDESAKYWYGKAVENSDDRAMNNLAILLSEGEEWHQINAESQSLFAQAADLGNQNAIKNLIEILNTRSDEENLQKANEYKNILQKA
ncbi:tetratricopeptide repeat protein [Vibrio cholerae]|uniref:tetratricopeptide repeat protein n=1 Tax=Vibrio cholerae TaxID=666 RepID=UPI0011581F4A|nr:tetratricopeptide repeat protein [Vibrio cholerae]TQQ73546.1 sel1 repeat family protein [Vibrio cholerae]